MTSLYPIVLIVLLLLSWDRQRLTSTPQTFSRSTSTILLFSSWSTVDVRRRPFYSSFHHASYTTDFTNSEHEVCPEIKNKPRNTHPRNKRGCFYHSPTYGSGEHEFDSHPSFEVQLLFNIFIVFRDHKLLRT